MLTQLSSNATSLAGSPRFMFTKIFLCSCFFSFWLVFSFFLLGQEKKEPSCQLSLKSFLEFSCQFQRQVNARAHTHTHTHNTLLFPSGCSCIALMCFVRYFTSVALGSASKVQTHSLSWENSPWWRWMILKSTTQNSMYTLSWVVSAATLPGLLWKTRKGFLLRTNYITDDCTWWELDKYFKSTKRVWPVVVKAPLSALTADLLADAPP